MVGPFARRRRGVGRAEDRRLQTFLGSGAVDAREPWPALRHGGLGGQPAARVGRHPPARLGGRQGSDLLVERLQRRRLPPPHLGVDLGARRGVGVPLPGRILLGEAGAFEEEVEPLHAGEFVVLGGCPLAQHREVLPVVLRLARPPHGNVLGPLDLVAVEVDRRLPAGDRHAGRQPRAVRGDELRVAAGERAFDDSDELTLHGPTPNDANDLGQHDRDRHRHANAADHRDRRTCGPATRPQGDRAGDGQGTPDNR